MQTRRRSVRTSRALISTGLEPDHYMAALLAASLPHRATDADPRWAGSKRHFLYPRSAAGPIADYHFTLYMQMAFQFAFFLAAPKQILRLLRQNLLLLACLVLIFASVLWTENLGNTLRMGTEVVLLTLFVCYLRVRFSTQALMRLLIFDGVATAISSAVWPSHYPLMEYSPGMGEGVAGNLHA